jgi:hypothetical protein
MALGGFAALVIALLVTVAVMVHPWASSLDLALLVRPDHAKYVVGQLKAQFEAQPPTAALAKEQGRLDADAFLKLPSAPGFRSEGKRVCHLSGVPVAWIMGRDGQLPVSVVVLRRNELGHFRNCASVWRLGTGSLRADGAVRICRARGRRACGVP